jgi:hypothetical protein
MPDSKYKTQIIGIAEGRAISLGKAKNRRLSWEGFGKELKTPVKTNERQSAFLKLPKEEQDKLKAVPGWFLGAAVEEGRRKRSQIKSRSLITLDCDEISPALLESIRSGKNAICRFEFYAHTTRKHRPSNPRLRIYLLPTADFASEKYDAVSRILAELIDPSLDSVDDVSFRSAQMMFKPSVSKDQEYLAWHNDGVTVDVDDILDSFRLDWRDYRNLPYSESRGQRRKTHDKAENPLEKRGVVGAFCRAYSVEEAMEAFIPDVYLPGDTSGSKPRYSYSEGTTSNGVVVEDDGLFIYSHHGSDPCGETLCNAFDMVRIHRFDAQDDKKKEGQSPKDWPSFKAMIELVSDDTKVKAELLAERVDVDEMFDDISDPDDDDAAQELRADGATDVDDEIADLLAPSRDRALPDLSRHRRPPKPIKGWPQRELELDQNGRIKTTIPNLATIITNDPRLWGGLGRNEFTNKVTIRRPLKTKLTVVPSIEVEDTVNGEDLTDVHDVSIKAILESESGRGKAGWGLSVARGDVADAILLVAQRWRFHPVQEYYNRITWDGKKRISRIPQDILGTDDHPYYVDAITLTLVATVARVFNPGHKWDHAPILSGEQGIRKSSFLKALYGDAWSGELTAHMASNKDSVEQMLGKLCLELPELATMRRSESEDVKAFMTFTEDRVRLAYDRRMSNFKRQCVFWGTTNANEYLKDPTGNRRFWPIAVTVSMIDTDWIVKNRDQLWAEAVHIWKTMAREAGDYRKIKLALSGRSLLEAQRLQDLAREEDSTENTATMISAWADQTMPLSHFLSDTPDSLQDLSSFDGEPMVRRTVMSARQVAVEVLGVSLDRLAMNRSLDSTVGHALMTLDTWKRIGSRRVMEPYGHVRPHIRIAATAQEILLGYQVVGHTGAGEPPAIESDDSDEDSIL